ncbi:CLUMA_CG016772, isoform A [Clunio marinus]|uniref:CLUMA_CG016772, isoform A n=1 Tax=Clunio marinus TaxID=568069 RepID=A0A1J1IW16_9DIPT|nr:CLUMA_CG016772, isoform A [Clunio marinus]
MKASLAVQLILIVKLVLCINCDSDSKTSDDDKCEIHLEYFQESLMQHEMWAIEMFDSWTKFQSGALFGNRVDFGNYEQCLDFHHESNDSRVGTINTQHCLIYYEATENIEAFDWYDIGSILRQKHLRLGGGVCLPSSCSATRIQSFINDFIKSADLRLAKDYDQSEWCTIGEREAFKTIDIVCM